MPRETVSSSARSETASPLAASPKGHGASAPALAVEMSPQATCQPIRADDARTCHHGLRQRAAYLLAAVPAGLSFTEIAAEIAAHGLVGADPRVCPYRPAHAEWEYWLAVRAGVAPPSWSWPIAEGQEDPDLAGPALLCASILGQAVRDLERAMPCTLGLYNQYLAWPRCSDHHCDRGHHACAPGAFAALLSPRADYFATLIGLEPSFLRRHVRAIAAATRAAHPWLTFRLAPLELNRD